MRYLVTGGNRSGKSAYAEKIAADSGLSVIYLATAVGGDAEMAARIEQHRRRRPAHWGICEETRRLAWTLQQHSREDGCILLDCITLWLANFITAAGVAADYPEEKRLLLDIISTLPGMLIIVTNELGMGMVPADHLSRWYRDEVGELNQQLARNCHHVVWITAGLPIQLK